MSELRKERDDAKERLTEVQINHNRDIEEERSKRRTYASENDSLKFKVQCLEDDLQKSVLDLDQSTK